MLKSRLIEFVRALVSIVHYIMVDINCHLKVIFKSRRSKFFIDDDSLNEAIEQERIQ